MHRPRLELRTHELQLAEQFLPDGCRVLDVGAGNGWQAQALASLGYQTVAVDLPEAARQPDSFYTVLPVDGYRLPFRSSCFDGVFTSHVLEHVADLSLLLEEVRRVLKETGVAVHLVPSPAWRFWTIVARYPFLLLLTMRKRALPETSSIARNVGDREGLSLAQSVRRDRGLWGTIRTALVEGPHGEFRSSFHELLFYRRHWWQRTFEKGGFEITTVTDSELFYTGYRLLPHLSIRGRQRLSKVLGSASHIFIVRPVAQTVRT